MVTTRTVGADVLNAKILSLFEAVNAHDVEKIVKLHTSDAVWSDPTTPEPVVGKPAIRTRLVQMFTAFPDLHFPVEDIDIIVAEDGTKAVATWTAVSTMRGPIMGFAPTGKTARYSGVCVYGFRGEFLSRHTIVYDSMSVTQQLGLLPGTTGIPMRILTSTQRVAMRVLKMLPRR